MVVVIELGLGGVNGASLGGGVLGVMCAMKNRA